MIGTIIEIHEEYWSAPFEALWCEIHSHIIVKFKNGKTHDFVFNDMGKATQKVAIGDTLEINKRLCFYSEPKLVANPLEKLSEPLWDNSTKALFIIATLLIAANLILVYYSAVR